MAGEASRSLFLKSRGRAEARPIVYSAGSRERECVCMCVCVRESESQGSMSSLKVKKIYVNTNAMYQGQLSGSTRTTSRQQHGGPQCLGWEISKE